MRVKVFQIRLAIGRACEVDQKREWLSDTDATSGVMAGAMADTVVLVVADDMLAG